MKSVQRFFYDVLDAQNPLDDNQQISDTRIYQLLENTQQITPQEQKQLLSSPATRTRFSLLNEVLKMEQAEAMSQWEPILALAAADQEVKPIRYDKTAYQLQFFPLDPDGKDWQISLMIKDQQMQAQLSMGVQLIDDQGLVWLQGPLDQQNTLQGFWTQSANLLDLLHHRTLYVRAMPI